MICPFQVSDCIRLLTRHFCNERRRVGLHGLYTKYNVYSCPLATFMSMLAHLLVSKSILEDANDNSDKRKYLTVRGFSVILIYLYEYCSCPEAVDRHPRHVQPLDLPAGRERDGGL